MFYSCWRVWIGIYKWQLPGKLMALPEEGFTDISFGGEVRSGPSNPEKFFLPCLKTEFKFLIPCLIPITKIYTLFMTFAKKPVLRQSDKFAIDTLFKKKIPQNYTLSGRRSPLSPYKGFSSGMAPGELNLKMINSQWISVLLSLTSSKENTINTIVLR